MNGRKADPELTRRRIRQSLLDLMQSMDFKEITVTRLCSEAGVSRGTYYLHYSDKLQVLDELLDIALDRPGDDCYRCTRTDEEYACPYGICDRVREHPEYGALFFDESLTGIVVEKITMRSMDRYVRELTDNFGFTPNQARTVFKFQLNGCLAINRDAFHQGLMLLENNRDLIGRFIQNGLCMFTR